MQVFDEMRHLEVYFHASLLFSKITTAGLDMGAHGRQAVNLHCLANEWDVSSSRTLSG